MLRRKKIKNPKRSPRMIKKRTVKTPKLIKNRYTVITYIMYIWVHDLSYERNDPEAGIVHMIFLVI